MVGIGILFIVIGVVCLFVAQSAAAKLKTLASTETLTAKALADLCAQTITSVGKGGFRYMVEVTGRLECATHLQSEITRQACAGYKSEMVQEYEETTMERNTQTGQQTPRTRTGSETITHNVRLSDFHVVDETGRTRVHPESAEIDWVKVTDKFEPHNSPAITINAGGLAWGGIGFSLAPSQAGTWNQVRPGRQIRGYRFTEYILPLNQNVFVVGEASDAMGELMISRPSKGGSFLVSSKSEEQLAAGARATMRNCRAASGILFAGGAILARVGLVK
jgi:hypothetical protein